MSPLTSDLIARAQACHILEVACRYGALERVTAIEFAGPCPICGGTDRFSVNTRKQLWRCRRCDKGGDVIELVKHVEGASFVDAIKKLTGETWTEKPVKTKARRIVDEGDDLNFRRAAALWSDTLPLGTEAKAYFARRGVEIEAVPDCGGLRWHPRCPWGPGGFLAPCVVARFTNAATGEPGGVWRRRIDEPTEKPRTLGSMAGCVIRLWPDEEATTGLVIGEGVETTLAAATRIKHRGTLLQPAWACGGAGNLRAFPALAGIEALTILVDNDLSGGGQDAAAVCARRLIEAGCEVTRLTPKILGGDFNDLVRGRGAA
jgi:phage/plasmid primase-like uncharacterized protein